MGVLSASGLGDLLARDGRRESSSFPDPFTLSANVMVGLVYTTSGYHREGMLCVVDQGNTSDTKTGEENHTGT